MKIDEIIKGFNENPEGTKMCMFQMAYAAVMRECEYGNANIANDECEFDLKTINYSHFCDELGWPDFQDGGIFEQVITEACRVVCRLYGYNPKY